MIKRLIKIIPSTITCMNLLSGTLACILAFRLEETMLWGLTGMYWAFIWIGLASVFDFMDGAMARLLHAYSDIGKELDSLSDLVSFGVAPSLLLFNAIDSLGGSTVVAYCSLFIAVMGALRLARFNVDTRQTTSFIGLPIPANALLWVGILSWMELHQYPGNVVMIILILVGGLMMVSNIPMFSLKFKNFRLRQNFWRYLLVVATAVFVLVDGVPGLAWTVLFYILLSVVTRTKIQN